MTQLSAAWYTSATFWTTTVSAVVAVISAGIAAWATLRAVRPKLRLAWTQHRNAPLIANGAPSLNISYDGSRLREPRMAEISVRNRGERDITSSMFHNGDPIAIEFGANVKKVLDVSTSPDSSTVPEHEPSGTKLIIKPSRLAKDQCVEWTVLLDGPETDPEFRSPLVDVVVVEEEDFFAAYDQRRRRYRRSLVGMLAVLALLASASTVLAYVTAASARDARDGLQRYRYIEYCRYYEKTDPQRANEMECPPASKPSGPTPESNPFK